MLAAGPAARCPRCQEENAPGTKFCGGCGARLSGACTACGTFNPAGQKFCGECGAALARDIAGAGSPPPGSYTPRHLAEKILDYRSSLEGERKQVTVLFADVKSSLELLADRDPEDARKLLDAVLSRMMEAVHRYEGTVNQVMGDGIMAIFGAPVAHEDHAVRACYAALRIQRRIARFADQIRRTEGLSIQVRIGINSGEVVVRSISSDLRMDYTAVGQTTHLAGRMEQLATPGSILITVDTLRLAEGYIQVKALGGIPVKGMAAPVETYEVVGAGPVRSRLQAAAARGFTRFVGRAAEMAALHEALLAAAAGQMQVVAVAGEAGVGKSRLLHEFIHSSRTRGCLVLESSSVSYGKATPYLPLIEFLKHYFKIEDNDDTRAIREKVTGKVLMLDDSLQDAIPALFDLLEALPEEHAFRSLEPLQRRQNTMRALTQLMLCESRVQPVIAMFEDLHWNDSLTLDLLKGLIASLGNARLLLLVSYRPDYQDEWKTRPHYRQVRLEPLPRASVEELLHGLLGADPKLAGLNEFLIERTGGNPLFLEEIVRTLVETQVLVGERGNYRLERPFSGVQVPATVQAVLAARIDRLLPEEKRLLQDAAVIGTDVLFRLLRAIVELPEEDLRRHLATLQSTEFIYETRLFPDIEYTFKHAFTHEVTYAGLLHARRREIHRRILAAIESLYGDRLQEQTERLAHHAYRGEEWEKAAAYARKAGWKAAARSAHREAILVFEQALSALEHLPSTPERATMAIDIRFDLRNSHHPLGELAHVLRHLEQARLLAERLGDQRRLGWVFSYLSQYLRLMGAPDKAIEFGERSLAIGRELKDFALETATKSHLGPAYRALGQYRRAADILRSNLDGLDGDRELEHFGLAGLPTVISRTNLVWALAELGEFAEGASTAAECVRIAEAANDSYSLIFANLGSGMLALTKGELPQACRVLEYSANLCRTWTVPVLLPVAASLLGLSYALAGRFDDALPLLEEAVERATSMSLRASQGLFVARLAEGCLLAGRGQEARQFALRALELSRELKERGNEAYALRLLGDAMAQGGPRDAEQAENLYANACALAKELEMLPLLAHCHASLGRLCGRRGKANEAAEHLATAAKMFRELDMQFWQSRIQAPAKASA